MKQTLLLAALLLAGLAAQAQLTIPSDGSDGVLDVPAGETRIIDLRQAISGRWDANNAAHSGQGIYDPDKWAIVFKYASVNVAGTVVFANHPSRAPVVWLIKGEVTISGLVDLTGDLGGENPIDALVPAEPGPGGFRGGVLGPLGEGNGYGPGVIYGGSAQYANLYGNPQIVPLIGGSGSAGYAGGPRGGAGGGGAILIAAAGSLDLTGRILANAPGGSAASGGAVKLVAGAVIGGGEVQALNSYYPQNVGRIRIETLAMSPTLRTAPETIAVVPANPPILWPPATAPTVRVLRVDGVDAPADPVAPLAATADIVLQNEQPVEVVVETRNFPVEGYVEVKGTSKFSTGGFVFTRASYVSGDFDRALWKVTQPMSRGFTVLQARAYLP